MPDASAPEPGGMREFDLDDEFWPGALAALVSDAPTARLRERWPACADLLDELASDAAREPLLIGVRLGTSGRNSRLFAVLTGAFLARSGLPTLVVDLSPDTRWLEKLLGAEFKEGLIDHLRFDVPLERCERRTALEGLSAMSGGAWFLAGSPLDDAPGFRAALERLRQRQRALVVTLPPPLETSDATGVPAICGALLTVEEGNLDSPLAGSERAVVRLTGDSEAGRDLAHLAHRFLGSLPLVLGGLARARRDADAHPPVEEEVDFLRRFERTDEPKAASSGALAFDLGPTERPDPERRRRRAVVPPVPLVPPAPPSPAPVDDEPRRRRTMVATLVAAVVVVAIGVSGRGVASDVVGWLLGKSAYERNLDEYAPGETIALDAPLTEPPSALADTAPAAGDSIATVDSVAAPVAAADSAATAVRAAPERRRRPAPFSLHVGSYQSVASGLRVVERVEALGYVATLAPVSLPGKGRWFRVYVGAYADSAAARRVLDRLRGENVIEEGAVKPTPWAFEIGDYPTPEAARAEAAVLRAKGIVAYPVGDQPARLYAGAYQSQEEAELLARAIEEALRGQPVRLTLREE